MTRKATRTAKTAKTATMHVAHSAHPRSVPTIVPDRESEQLPDQPFAEGRDDGLDSDLRHRMISEAAYHRYIERGYAEGYDLDDWLQAEAEVDHLLLDHARDEAPRGGD